MTSKILLVTSSFEGISRNKIGETSEYLHYPLGLTYLHAYLESKGNFVMMAPLNHKPEEVCFSKVDKMVRDFSPEFIGFQVLTATRVSTYKLIEHIHKTYPEIRIILGGIHATVMYSQLVEKYPFILVVLGEGEVTIQELTKELKKKKPHLDKVDGIAYFDGKRVTRTKKREPIQNLDTLPFPNHGHFLKDKKRTTACLLTSRGCYFACSFCCLNPELKRMVRFRSVGNVVDEIEYIYKMFPHISEVFIHDDTFFVDNKRVMAICDEIIRRKIKMNFQCSGRMNPISPEMITKLEEAGFKIVMLGLESGAREILKSCHKGITPENAINAFKLFKNSSINLKVFLIVGLPGETSETVDETIRLVKKLQKIKYISFANDVNLLTIYPGTEVYEIAKSKGFVDDSYWLTNKETPIYTAENTYDELEEFKERISNNISFRRLKTFKGFKSQIEMIPYLAKYLSVKILERIFSKV